MTVLTDLHTQRVLYVDGEALDTTDLNDGQKLVRAQFLDGLLIGSIADAIDDPTSLGINVDLESGEAFNNLLGVYDDVIYTPFPSCGYIKPGGSARQLLWTSGTIIKIADEPFNANGEAIAMFRLVNDGVGLTTAVGDATNPRIDLVEVQLAFVDSDSQSRDFEDATTRAKSSVAANRKRSVRCTIQIKQGTPAATPAYPTPSVGFVPIAAIRVPATHNAVHDPLNLRDLRVPIGHVTCYDVIPTEMWYPGANPWTRAEGNPVLDGTAVGPAASTGELVAVCPVGNKNARLVGVGIYQQSANSARLMSIDHNAPSTPTLTTLADLSGGSFSLVGAAGFRAATMTQLAVELGAAGAPANNIGTRVANTHIGTPMWCSGYPAGLGKPGSAFPATPFRQLAVGITGGASDRVNLVRFYVAHGL